MTASWDFFISHASEDKATVARPLANSLELAGYRTWFDEFELLLGSPLRATIDEGLANSRFGVVILSPAFFSKKWPKAELDALFSQEDDAVHRIFPVWHELTEQGVARHSPLLASRVAVSTSTGIPNVRAAIMKAAQASGLGDPLERLHRMLDDGDLNGIKAFLDANPAIVLGDHRGYSTTLFARPSLDRWDGAPPDFALATQIPTPMMHNLQLIFLGPISSMHDDQWREVITEVTRMLTFAAEEAESAKRLPNGYRSRISALLIAGRRAAPYPLLADPQTIAVRSYDSLGEGWRADASPRFAFYPPGHVTSLYQIMREGH